MDSCVTQDIYKLHDNGLEVRGVFLDIYKAFDKVWHEGLLLKLNRNSISGTLLQLLRDFLSCRKQPVVLNGQRSSWDDATTGSSQGFILWRLLFLICINDLSNYLFLNCKRFANDTYRFCVVTHTSATISTQDLNAITNWSF